MANITGTNRVTASFFSGTHAYGVLPFPHAGDMRTGMAFLIEPKDHDLVTAAAKHCESPAIGPAVTAAISVLSNKLSLARRLNSPHFNVIANPSELHDLSKYVIVDLRHAGNRNSDWMTSDYDVMLAKVKDQIEGKWVRFEGWMLYDYIHANQSRRTQPNFADVS